MKNIFEILKKLGVEIPSETKAEMEREVTENYKTISEFDRQKAKLDNAIENNATHENELKQRDNDLLSLQTQLKTAGVDTEKLSALQTSFDTLNTDYSTSKTAHEKAMSEQKYDFLIKEKTNGLDFTSKGAKSAFLADLKQKNLAIDGESLLGLDDFVANYKLNDTGAFASEKAIEPVPTFTAKGGTGDTGSQSEFGFNFTGVRPKQQE